MSEHETYSPEQSSFVAGFSLGLIAGAAGYFLFGTARGAQLRRQLVEEWESAQDELIRQGALPTRVNLRQYLQQQFEHIFQASLPDELLTSSKLRKGGKIPARRVKKGSKFSGT